MMSINVKFQEGREKPHELKKELSMFIKQQDRIWGIITLIKNKI